jgi:predicted nucleic acid-binding protein
MILVDSSVWIAYLRGLDTPTTSKLHSAAAREQILVGDIVLVEILQGARDDLHAAQIERDLRRFVVVTLLGDGLASQAARNFRILRNLGITIRGTTDLIIGTFCIERRHTLLHDDRDFDPMEKHLGLRVA